MSSKIITIFLIATCFSSGAIAVNFQQLVNQVSTPPVDLQSQNSNSPFNCTNPQVQCSGHGYCNADHTACNCMSAYATFQPQPGTQCNYERYRQVDLFCFQFFLGEVGVADWIIHQYGIAAGKLALALSWGFIHKFLLYAYVICKQTDRGVDDFEKSLKPLRKLIGLAIGIWWLVSTIYYGMNKYTDQNGISPLNAPGLGNQGFVQ